MVCLEDCRVEIETLHAFFVDWYAARVDRDRFARLEGALAPEFTMVAPDGTRRHREDVLAWIRDSYGRDTRGEFGIDIRNVDLIENIGGHALVRYEEWQRDADDETGRISTVLLRADETAPDGLQWVDLHETLIEAE